VWAAGDAYEPYIGRWSRLVARELLAWLGVAGGAVWLDVGCGTGALAGAVLEVADPAALVGLDPSTGFVAHARARLGDPRARFLVADARRLPLAGAAVDAAVSGLVLNSPLCRPEPLAGLLRDAGLAEVEARPLRVPTVFRDFDDYWTPFLGGQGPAPGHAMSLDEPGRAALREALRARLPAAADGSIALTARAWAVAGRRPGPVSGR
jgi:SAM-dependent methyltransferase